MRIGVLANIQHSMFSSGLANASISVAELMISLGHTADLINIRDDTEWWDDCNAISIPVVKKSEAVQYDIVFEIDRMTLSKEERPRLAKKSIWILRHPFIIGEMESALFPVSPTTKRDLEGLTETWIYDAAAAAEPTSVQVIELLTKAPVRIVPYLWSPSIVRTYLGDTKSWLENTVEHMRELSTVSATSGSEPVPKWTVNVAEKNTSNASNATVPLVILRELKRRGLPIESCKVYNTDILKQSKFFMENIVRNTLDEEVGLSGEFIARQRSADWARTPMSCVLSHIRFSHIRPMLLDTVWTGIPTIHNSVALRGIGDGVERLFYNNNSVGEAVEAFQRLQSDFLSLSGFFSPTSLDKIRNTITNKFTPSSAFVQDGWKEAMASLTEERRVPTSTSVLRVGFCDMWENFNPEYNFFTLMLSNAGSAMMPSVEVVGEKASNTSDIIIFGPFGSDWQRFPVEKPKVHFTGENTPPLMGPGIGLNLGFHHIDMAPDEYLRFPLWILEIDWFGADKDRIMNPKPIPLEACTKVCAADISKKKKFCAFVVSNPKNPARNSAFSWLSTYKHVDSAGAYMNNVGSQIFAGAGGGGGELKKFDFLGNYKFCIAYENASARGYTTEKYLHAKAAGCIPIYWGDPAIERDFNMAGAIDARNVRSESELIELVRKVDEDDSEWLKRYSVPALDEHRVEWCKRTMAEFSRRVFKMAGRSTESFPLILEPVKVPKATAAATEPVKVLTAASDPEIPVIVTCVSRSFLPSLQQCLISISTHRSTFKELTVIVYLFSDIPADTVKSLKEKFPIAEFRHLPDSVAPENSFADFWEPKHYGWKLWILDTISKESALDGSMVLYMDVGTFLCRWPKDWMLVAQANDVCFLEDPREENARWCSPEFCRALACTEAELAAQQIQAATIYFRAGSPKATRIFSEALKLAYRRDILVGPKWSGTDKSGKPTGHRHDQSILSILSMRHGIPRLSVDTVQCGISLRKTFISGKSIYIHRGRFAVHTPVFPMIDDAYVINLERRKDRLDRLWTSSPELKGLVERWPAIDGRKLELTPAIARLLKPNDFFWKKAVTGCALSHLGLWWKLANENTEVSNYLILEDDVEFQPNWLTAWKTAVEDEEVPDDYDIIYLGGILPPNREMFAKECKEPVNSYFSRIKENSIWGQAEPSRYFHFCAYAYILSKAGAKKVISLLNQNGGYWTSADHILCNPVTVLKSYVFEPTIAGCYQDSDPAYANSQFNDFSRVDGFDSDLWNNDERFSVEDISTCMKAESPIDIKGALEDASRVPKAAPQPPPPPQPLPQPLPPQQNRFMCLEQQALEFKGLYEGEWLLEYFGYSGDTTIGRFKGNSPPPSGCPIIFVMRPYVQQITDILERWDSFGASFYVIHLSDELCMDSLELYKLNGCKKVLRIYNRPDVPCPEKVTMIPLGYHYTRADPAQDPLVKTPKIPFRETLWSFVGTSWQGRIEKLQPLMSRTPNKPIFLNKWNGPDCLKKEEYVQLLLDSVFVPCPGGNNPETFRFYEALDCGCVPIVVADEYNLDWLETISEHLPLLPLRSWEEAANFIGDLWNKKEMLEAYRNKLLSAWMAWKAELSKEGKAWLV